MKFPAQKAPIPPLAKETVRQAMASLLTENALSAHDISAELQIAEKEVYTHLAHLRRTLQASGGSLEVTPAECRRCGYVFAKRDRLTPPGKCPICRYQAIADPLFKVHFR